MQRDPIRLYWWSRPDMVNLGDELGRDVVEFASGRKVVQATAEDAELLAIGSILNFVQKNVHLRQQPYLVWGSGSLGNAERTRQESFICTALRGPLTFSLLEQHLPVPFGDPGILTSAMWPHGGGKTHRWGVVPHYSQLDKPWVKRLLDETPNAILIDVRDPDIEASCRKIASCDFVAATSLHGLIIADSYQIPNVWLTDGSVNNTWKYWDYFAGIGRRGTAAVSVDKPRNLTAFEGKLENTRYFATLPLRMKALLAAFPM